MQGWKQVRVGEVCQLLNGRAYKQPELLRKGPYPVLRVGNFFSSRDWYYSDLELERDKYCDDGDLLYAWSASFGPKIWQGGKSIYHYHIWKTRIDAQLLDKKFLFYWFDWDKEKIKAEQGAGATMVHVTKGAMEARPLWLPPLSEQKRIVAILDEAFEGVDRAVANAETNLLKVRGLFEDYLESIFEHGRTASRTTTLGQIAEFKNGINFTKSSKGENIKIVGVSDFQKNFWVPMADLDSVQVDGVVNDDYLLRSGDILTVRSNGNKQLIGRCLLAGEVAERTSHSGFTIRIRSVSEDVIPEFLAWQLKAGKSRRRLVESGDGANISSLNQTALASLPIILPSEEQQVEVVGELKSFAAKTERLAEVARAKLVALSELKRSILQKAFSGQLATGSAQLAVEKPVALRTSTQTPEFTAKVLAFAYSRHVSQQNERTVDRVKAQKILHLVESVAGIDLGRQPIKDAAGPNDSAHQYRAEDWARDAKLFEFIRRGKGYDFRNLPGYSATLKSIVDDLEPYRERLDRVLKIIVPMNSKDTEVLATVHAAWNNLMLDGINPTDEQIVTAARENWHPAKLEILRSKFFYAIKIIRKQKLEPDGNAKRVGGQESLL